MALFAADERFAWYGSKDEVARVDRTTGETVKRRLPGVERRRAGAFLVLGGRLVPADLSSDGHELPIDHDEGVVGLSSTRVFIQTPISLRALDNATLRQLWEVPAQGRWMGSSEEVVVGVHHRFVVRANAATGAMLPPLLPPVAFTEVLFVGRAHIVGLADGAIVTIAC